MNKKDFEQLKMQIQSILNNVKSLGDGIKATMINNIDSIVNSYLQTISQLIQQMEKLVSDNETLENKLNEEKKKNKSEKQ